jgi:hypothetical protein
MKYAFILILSFLFSISLYSQNNESKTNHFDINEYCRSTYKGNAKFYYEEIKNDTGAIVGYNVLGAFIIEGDSHDGVYGKSIKDPHFINNEGKTIIEGKLFKKVLNSEDDHIVTVFINPLITSDDFLHQGLGLEINDLDFYTCDPQFKNLKPLFQIDNTQRSSNEKIFDIDVLKNNSNSSESSTFYIFECGESGISNNTKGLIDNLGNILFENQFTDIRYLSRSGNITYFLVKNYENKFGIAKSNGSFLFEPNFEVLDVDNLQNSIIKLGKIEYQGKYGLIDKDYNIVIEPKYQTMQIINNKYAIVRFYDESGERWDFLNLETRKELGYKIQEVMVSNLYQNQGGGLNSEIAIKINNKWGFCNQHGKISIQPKYSFVTLFSEGIAFVSNKTDMGRFVLIQQSQNRGGRIYPDDPKSFLINESGAVIATFSKELSNDISKIGQFSEGLLLYKSRKSGQFGYINSKGQIIIQPVFEEADGFHEGRALVKRLGTTYYIDKRGNRINE